MYPPKPYDHYEPQSSAVATGIPISSTGQFYNPSAFQNQSQGPVPSTFQTQSPGPVPNSGTAFQSQPQRLVPWSSGLCGCCDDCGNCCLTCLCPCITFGQIAEIVDRGSTSCGASGALYALIVMFTGCGCLYSCLYRSKMRAQYSLLESPCSDCIVHCCCEMCALCQEYRELKRRGFDMSIGWQANMERQGRAGVTVPPAMQGGMSRY